MSEELNLLTELATSFIERISAFLPSLISGLFILLVGWIVARLLATAVSRLADRINLSKLLEKGGLAGGLEQAGLKQSPGDMMGRLIFWLVFLNFLLIALETMGLDSAVEPLKALIAFLPRVLIGIIMLIGGSILAEFIGKASSAALLGMGIDFHESLGRIIRALTMVVVIIVVIQQMGLDVTLLNDTFVMFLTITFAGLALAFGLGGRHLARGVLAGFYAREVLVPGDIIVIDEFEGTIESIGTINTELRNETGRLIIPNIRLTEEAVRTKKSS